MPKIIRVSEVTRSKTIIVTPASDRFVTPDSNTFGSLEDGKLQLLSDDFDEFAATTTAHRVVIDLGGVRAHGSAFINSLIKLSGQLRQRGIACDFCGDQTGLVKLVRMDAWNRIYPDLYSALEVGV